MPAGGPVRLGPLCSGQENKGNVEKSLGDDQNPETLYLSTRSFQFCLQGKSRSTTVLVAILCIELEKPVSEILAFVKNKRSMADPNPNFFQQLLRLESEGCFKKV